MIKLEPNSVKLDKLFSEQFSDEFYTRKNKQFIFLHTFVKERDYIIPMLTRMIESGDHKQINMAYDDFKKIYTNGNQCPKEHIISCLNERKNQLTRDINNRNIKKAFALLNPKNIVRRKNALKEMRVPKPFKFDENVLDNDTSLVLKMLYLNENQHKLKTETKNELINKILLNITNCDEKCLKEEKDGYYPIHLAILLGNDDIINKLLENNEIKSTININSEEYSYTPLVLAIKNRNINVIEKLLKLGADVNKKFMYLDQEMTPLEYFNTFIFQDGIENLQNIANLLNAKYTSQGGSSRQYILKKRISKKQSMKKRISKKQSMKKSYRKESYKHKQRKQTNRKRTNQKQSNCKRSNRK